MKNNATTAYQWPQRKNGTWTKKKKKKELEKGNRERNMFVTRFKREERKGSKKKKKKRKKKRKKEKKKEVLFFSERARQAPLYYVEKRKGKAAGFHWHATTTLTEKKKTEKMYACAWQPEGPFILPARNIMVSKVGNDVWGLLVKKKIYACMRFQLTEKESSRNQALIKKGVFTHSHTNYAI